MSAAEVGGELPDACDHPTTMWVDDETGWKCYDCGFVIGHLDPTPTNADEMAALVRAIVKHHEANHKGPQRFCADPACAPPKVDLIAHAAERSQLDLGDPDTVQRLVRIGMEKAWAEGYEAARRRRGKSANPYREDAPRVPGFSAGEWFVD